MGKTKIEWATKVWNPVTGCTKISPGCDNCYAERMSKRFAEPWGLDIADPFKVTLYPERMKEPLRWRKPSRIFVCSMGDLFHDDVPDKYLDQVFAIMAKASQHIFLVLTKRPDRMRNYIIKAMYDEDCNYQGWYEAIDELGIPDVAPMGNVWLGVTAENQEQADKRIPILLQIPAAVRFVSVEPMLSAVKIIDYLGEEVRWNCHGEEISRRPGLNWVICGGESGPGARPMHPDWIRWLRDQCQVAGVPFMFKQWGEYGVTCCEFHRSCDGSCTFCSDKPIKMGKKKAGRLLDGREWDEYPEVGV